MDLIKGLENGFCHTWVTGNSKERFHVFNKKFKTHIEKGIFIRDVQNAPRDARYKIDYYYNQYTTINDTIGFPNINYFHIELLKFLNINETFNWKEKLKDTTDEYSQGDFDIGYNEYGYYFKYKGKINTLIFSSSPNIVDYSDKFWAKYKDEKQYYSDVSTLLHNIRYFMLYNGMKIKS